MRFIATLVLFLSMCVWSQSDSLTQVAPNTPSIVSKKVSIKSDGFVSITSGMTKANIWVDGAKLGIKTPYEKLKLTVGNHSLFIENQFFFSDTLTIQIEPGKTKTIDIPFREKYAFIHVASNVSGEMKHRGVVKKFPLKKEHISIIDAEIVFSSYGYEAQTHYLKDIPHRKSVFFDITLEKKSRFNTFYRSLMFPGLAQHYTERKTIRNIWGAATIAGIGWLATSMIMNGPGLEDNSLPIIAVSSTWVLNILDGQLFYPYNFEKKSYSIQ